MNTLTLMILVTISVLLSACGGGRKHADPIVASQEAANEATKNHQEYLLRSAVEANAFTLQQQAESNRQEIARAQLGLQERAAVFAGQLKEFQVRTDAEQRKRSSELFHDWATKVAVLGGLLGAALYGLRQILTHRAEEIAFKTEQGNKNFAIKSVCEALPSLSEDVQRAILLRMTDGALPAPGKA